MRTSVGGWIDAAMRGPWRCVQGIGLVAALVVFSGCGQPTDGRVPIAGEVLLDGQPLDRGSIEFHPTGEGGTLTGGTIANGKFDIPATQGPKPGNYQVRIFAASESATVDPNEPPGPEAERQVSKERVPARFNVQSELTAQIGDQGDKALKFSVESK